VKRSADLTTPRLGRGLGLHYDPEAFGRFSEAIARTLGTARFLVAQTVLVVVWIALNVVAAALRFDPYPFILLNLAFSTQAAYAARSSSWPRTARTPGTGPSRTRTAVPPPGRRPRRSTSPGRWPTSESWSPPCRPPTSSPPPSSG